MAFARVSFVKLKPNISIEKARKIWDESIAPAAKDQNGFIGCFLLVSEQADEGVAVSIWVSKSDADAGEKSGYYQDQVKKLAAFLTPPPERKYYNVNSDILFIKELLVV